MSLLFVLLCRSWPRHHSKLRAVLYPRHIPPSPVRRNPARVQTCRATRSHRLPCQQPALDLWLLLRLQPRSPSLSAVSRVGPRTRRPALGEMEHRSVSALYPTTPPSGMWRRFMSSSVHYQVSRLCSEGTIITLYTPMCSVHETCLPVINCSLCLCCFHRLPGDSRRVSLSGNRWTGLAPVKGGPPDEHYEH